MNPIGIITLDPAHFHAALVRVRRHGVPDIARLKLGQAHGELAGFQHVRVDELVDDALVRRLVGAHRHLLGGGEVQERGLVGAVRRGRHAVELGRVGLVVALERLLGRRLVGGGAP